MASVGKILAAERKRRGIDIKDVERQTRIHARYLLAIENDDWETLPAGAYARAFVASYARFFGFDPQALLAELSRPAERPERADGPVMGRASRWEQRGDPTGARRRRGSRNRLPLAIVLAALIGFGFLLSLSQGHDRASAPKAPGATAGTSPASPPAARSTTSLASVSTSDGAVTEDTVKDSGPVAKGRVTVRLAVRGDSESWVRIVADNRKVFEGVLGAGEEREWSAKRRLYIRVGDGGAVRAFLNGERLPRLGGDGEVVDRVFSAAKKEGDG